MWRTRNAGGRAEGEEEETAEADEVEDDEDDDACVLLSAADADVAAGGAGAAVVARLSSMELAGGGTVGWGRFERLIWVRVSSWNMGRV